MPALVGILTRGFVSSQWALALRNLALPTGSVIRMIDGLPFDHARNSIVMEMMKTHSDWLLFLDDDVIPPPDAFGRLTSHRREIVSALCYRRQGKITPAMFREASPIHYPVESYSPGELLEVDLVGAGCLAVHRNVFERLDPPWFEWLIDREDLPLTERVGEDLAFARKARRAGFGIFVDTSVACLHVGLGRSDTDGHFLPLEAP